MRSPVRLAPLLLLAAVTLARTGSAAITVDGRLDPDYGAALATQSLETSFEDANPAFSPDPVRYADGTELDALYGAITDGVLHVFVSGNLGFCCPTAYAHQEEFDLFIDSRPGGQHTLRADNPTVGWFGGNTLNGLAGLSFDAVFAADYWLGCTINMASAFAELLPDGGGAGYDLGYNVTGAPGTLAGGTDPAGILAALDDSNGAGVTAGCASASGAGVTTGVEWAIPLAAIGDPTGCVQVCVLAADAETHAIGNQTLGPSEPGNCAFGAPAGVNLANLPGNQYVIICPAPTPASGSTWGRIKTLYR